jgi:hypothetical protein
MGLETPVEVLVSVESGFINRVAETRPVSIKKVDPNQTSREHLSLVRVAGFARWRNSR